MSPHEFAVMTGANAARAELYCEPFAQAMGLYEIDTSPRRVVMLLANVGHETLSLHYLRELWGPTPAQVRYEGRADLGNTEPGDGRRFLGRGGFNTTGRGNYARLRDRLRERFPEIDVPDFEAEPEALERPEWVALSACDYANEHKLNDYADAGDFDGYCDIINLGHHTKRYGDSNGFPDRLRLYAAGCELLGLS
jgi:putative chitinase